MALTRRTYDMAVSYIFFWQGLYTYNVREGDYFVLDVKTKLKPIKTR